MNDTPSQQPQSESKQEQSQGSRTPSLVLPSQAKSLDPFPWYREMRESHSMFYDHEKELWHVFRYDDAQRILSDPTTFSSEVMQRLITEEEKKRLKDAGADIFSVPAILNLDPPRHQQLRALVSQAFTPRTVARQEQHIITLVDEYLRKVAPTGRMDLIADLAYPLPMTVLAELLGVPTVDQAQFKQWSDIVLAASREEIRQAGKEMKQYLQRVTAQRRVDPREDLISSLIQAHVDGEHLTEDEVISFCMLLLLSGHQTVTILLGNAIWCFDEQPEVIEELRANPALLPNAIEEVLRYRSPQQRVIRVATRDAMLGEHTIKAGQLVSLWLGSANRDPEQFPHPETFDIHRSPNRHLGFGHSIHFCIGAHLARLEVGFALSMLLERFQSIKRDRELSLQRIPGESGVLGMQELPITFTLA